jgi:hypothetical protein
MLLPTMMLIVYAVVIVPAITTFLIAGDPIVAVVPALAGVLKN